MSDMLPAITGLGGLLTGGVASYVALRRDRREAVSQAQTEAAETVRMLKEQTELLRLQIVASQEREQLLSKRIEKLEDRIAHQEKDYRKLVQTVTAMRYCAEAPTCHNYNPGDRREK